MNTPTSAENTLRENAIPFDNSPKVNIGGVGWFFKKEDNNQNYLQSMTIFFQNIGTNFLQALSNPIGLVYWIFGLKWYMILCILVIGVFLFFQIETAIENKKQKRKMKKEGMNNKNVEKMRGILRYTDKNYIRDTSKKSVSFSEPFSSSNHEQNVLQYFDFHLYIFNTMKNIQDFFVKLYDLWMVPLIYITFRNIGGQ